MQYRKNIFLLLMIVLFITQLSSCSSRNVKYERIMLPYDSFAKIQTTISVRICLSEEECHNTTGLGSGSGTIIKHKNDKTYVLTAAHVCDTSDQEQFWESRGGTVTTSSIVIDFSGLRYPVVKNVITEGAYDLCVIEVVGTFGKEAPVGRIAPRIGDKVFNIAAPQGDAGPGMAAILEGRFSGLFRFPSDNKDKSAYTIPAIGGSSGSGVYNAEGQLIGIIHSVRKNFHHLSYGPTHDELMHFLKLFEQTIVHYN